MSVIHDLGIVVHGIVQTINAVKKTCIVVEAGMDAVSSFSDERLSTIQKTHRVATDALLVAFQALEVECSLVQASPIHQLDAEIGVGVADLLKIVSRIFCKENGWDSADLKMLGNTAFFRGLDVAGAAGDCFPNQREQLETGTQVAQALFVLLNNHRTITNATYAAGVRMYNALMFLRERRASRMSSSEGPSAICNGNPAATVTNENPEVTSAMSPEHLANLAYEEELEMMLNITDIEGVLTIPEPLHHYHSLKNYTCPITKKPIRTIIVTHRSRTESRNVYIYYEKAAITDWIRDRPSENPPGWPEGIPLSIDNPHSSTEVLQDVIDKALATALAEFCEQIRVDFPDLVTR